MIAFAPPLADVGGVIWAVIVGGFLLIGLLRQLFAAAANPNGPRPLGGPRPVPPRPAAPRRDPIADEIEQFLQQAQRRREAAGRATPSQRPPQPRPQDPEVEVEAVAGETVADHVRQRMAAPQFGQVAADLAKDMEQTDERLSQHLHAVFDHRLGRLGSTPGETAQTQPIQEAEYAGDRVDPRAGTTAADIAALLAHPATVRQAVILSEILRRPEDRWSHRA